MQGRLAVNRCLGGSTRCARAAMATSVVTIECRNTACSALIRQGRERARRFQRSRAEEARQRAFYIQVSPHHEFAYQVSPTVPVHCHVGIIVLLFWMVRLLFTAGE
jgi:hypothetical protein